MNIRPVEPSAYIYMIETEPTAQDQTLDSHHHHNHHHQPSSSTSPPSSVVWPKIALRSYTSVYLLQKKKKIPPLYIILLLLCSSTHSLSLSLSPSFHLIFLFRCFVSPHFCPPSIVYYSVQPLRIQRGTLNVECPCVSLVFVIALTNSSSSP